MSKPSLEGVDLRIERAKDQLTVLDDAVGTFLKTKKGAIVGEFDSDTSEYVFRVGGDQPPLYWGVTVGEIAHQLRAALNNLLWELVLARGNTPGTHTQFPITESQGAWDIEIEKRKRLKGISPSDVAFIQSAQPYQHGPYWRKRHLLSLLQYLNNTDKHRVLHAAFVAMGYYLPWAKVWLPISTEMAQQVNNLPPDGGSIVLDARIGMPPVLVKDVSDWTEFKITAGTSDDPAEILRVTIDPSGPDPQVKMSNEPDIQVSLSDRQRPITITDLQRIVRRVEYIVKTFRPAF